MSRLAGIVSTEWLKIRRYKPFWAVFFLYPVCLTGVVVISLWTQGQVQSAAGDAGLGKAVEAYLPFAFPHAWQSVAYLAGWLHFFPAILVILSVTNEFSFRTHRQNLLDGWSRLHFLSAKGALVAALSLYCTLATFLLTVVAGVKSGTVPGPEGARYIALFFLQSLVYTTFALFLAFLIRRAALALAAFLIYTTVVENFAAFLLNQKWKGAGHFLPLEAAGDLIPFPFLSEHGPKAARDLLEGPGELVLLGVSLFYLFLLLGLLWARFRREDL